MLRQDGYQVCDTIYYQGANCTQTQALHYTGNQKITATTGEVMWCTGINNLAPLNVIYNLHIGTEILDVNLKPSESYLDYTAPLKWAYRRWVATPKLSPMGIHILPAMTPSVESVNFHTPNPENVCYGQGSDILSHYYKYQTWLNKKEKQKNLILWGVSRGTAATFCAFAKHKYPEVKLVVLEGAIDSMENIVKNQTRKYFSPARADKLVEYAYGAISYLNNRGLFGYRRDGESPISLVNDFPENVPVVFITSKKDEIVFPENTANIASTLAARGKNDVYLLKLENSSHPSYMYDDKNDRDKYESFIHAIYRKYGLQHEPELADQGEQYIVESTLSINNAQASLVMK